MFAPCINSIKTLFIIPNDAHNYKIIGMLKTIKIPTVTPTCFGSRRNHHQGAIQCLAKTIVMALLCSSLLAYANNLMTARVSMLLKSRASPDMLPFRLCNKKRLAIWHMNRPLSKDTIDCPTTSGSRSG
jgi:hypothetical protein